MIYTVTFNPALDYVMRANAFSIGKTNRSEGESIYFGGKGINVSCVLGELGEATTALGFVAGFTGEALEKGLTEMGIKTDFVHLSEGMTRINIKIKGAEETELNAKGPSISPKELDMMMEKLEKIQDGDTLVLAGSVPGSFPSDIYERILERLSGKKIRTVVDAEKELLTKVLKYRPFLIKPNIHELSAIVGKVLTSDAETEAAARELQAKGAVNVLVSLGGDGALLVDENGEVHSIGVAKITAVNTVGAGDSMVAGFLAGANKGYGYALRLGTASGGATAASSGLATKEKIFELLGTL